MSFISSAFSNLTMNTYKGLANTGVNAVFSTANYRKRDGKLKFYSPRGYESVFVYAAKRTMMQMTFATINDLYPKYLRQLDQKILPQLIKPIREKNYKQSLKMGKMLMQTLLISKGLY